MAKVNAPLLAFNAGEVSRIALARIDVAKMRLAAECQLNWLPFVVGPMMLRPGLQYIGETASDNAAALLDFVYAKSDTALLELTPGVMRIWIDDVLLTRPSVSTAISDPNFAGAGTWSTADTSAGATTTIAAGTLTLTCLPLGGTSRAKQSIAVAGGDQVKEHGLRVVVLNGPVTVRIGSADGLDDILSQAVLDTGTHSLSFIPGSGNATIYLRIDSTDQWLKQVTTCTIEGAGVVTLPTPWGAGDFANLRWSQSGDVIFLACYGQQQRKIERRGVRPGARGWSVVLYRSNNGPFRAGPEIAANLTPSVCFGNGQINSDRPFFVGGHIGALIRAFTPGKASLAANPTLLGASASFGDAIRVAGVGVGRTFQVTVAGTWLGTISLQRSLDGPETGFVTVAASDTGWASVPTLTGNFSINYYDNASTASGVAYNNVVVWYRLCFEAGNYTSGSASVQFSYSGNGGTGIARIANVITPTQVTVEILQPFTAACATDDWAMSDWCGAFGWPTSVTFHEGRLGWFSGGSIPIALGQSDNYTGYAQVDRFGNPLGEAGAILEAFGEGPSDSVNWALPLSRLLAGREGSIGSIRSSSFDEPLISGNFSVKDCSTQGAARLHALKIDKRGIFVQQSGRRVYELAFDPAAMDYSAHDLTRLNADIGKPGFVDIDVSRQPDTECFFPRTEGQCAVLLYDPDDEVVGWWRMQTLGVIEGVRVLPAATGIEDRKYFVVKRVINGVTRRFIEKVALRDNCVGGAVNQLLDCHLVYQGAPVATVQAAWLPSTNVTIWADGAFIGTVTTDGAGNCAMPGGLSYSNIVIGLAGAMVTATSVSLAGAFAVGAAYNGCPAEIWADVAGTGKLTHLGAVTVAGGNVTLPNGAQAFTCVAAIGYVAAFQSAKLAYGAQLGSPLTQKKKIDHLGLALHDTHYQGLQSGQRFDVLDPLPLVEADQVTPANTIWVEYDEPMIEAPGEWDTDARLCLLAQAPYPCKVGGVVLAIATSETGAHAHSYSSDDPG